MKAVKTAQTTRATTARPPGIQPSSSRERLSIRRGVPLSDSRVPAKIKSGRETSSGVSARRDISITTTDMSMPTLEKESRARAAMMMNSGVPSSAMSRVK